MKMKSLGKPIYLNILAIKYIFYHFQNENKNKEHNIEIFIFLYVNTLFIRKNIIN